MEITNNLLVAMMFVMLLSIGIGNVLMVLPAFIDGRLELRLNWIPASWFILLFLQHLNLFWQTLVIIDVEQYTFTTFLYVVTGPVLLFLATSLMLPDPSSTGAADFRAQYSRVAPRFFSVLALLMAWMMGVDLVLASGLSAAAGWNLVLLIVFATLAISSNDRLHMLGTVFTWVCFLSLLALRGAGAIG